MPRGVIALVAMAALAPLAGCGSDDTLADSGSSSSSAPASGSESPSASPSESSSSPTGSATDSADPQAAVAETVKADFRQFFAAYVTSLRARDATVAKLIEYSTPSRQAQHRADIARIRQEGWRFKGTPKQSVREVIVDANRATLRVCEYDKAAYYVDESGQSPVAVKDRWVPFTLQLISRDGHWKVNKYEHGNFSCKGAS
jgi:hypothetical protein